MKKYALLLFFFLCVAMASTYAQVGVNDSVVKNDAAVDNFMLNDAIKMYPNPVQNYLSIQSSLPITGVQVYSLLGELIKDVPGNFSRIDLRNLNSGIYMIKIHSDQYAVTKKLIKK